MSRNARPLSQLSNEEQIEACCRAYNIRSILKDQREIIKEGKTLVPKDSSLKLYKFKEMLPEITVTGNGILLKGEIIILPEALQDAAIHLACRGSHSGKSGMERRLRYHFFFHNMNMKVDQFVKGCKDCQLFTDKRTTEPIRQHSVPSRSWKKVAVDLFWPLPSSNHAVVVQDLASRFPAAKVVSSSRLQKPYQPLNKYMMHMVTQRNNCQTMGRLLIQNKWTHLQRKGTLHWRRLHQCTNLQALQKPS